MSDQMKTAIDRNAELRSLLNKLKTEKTLLKNAATDGPDGTVLAWSECAIIVRKPQRAGSSTAPIHIGGKQFDGNNTVGELISALDA